MRKYLIFSILLFVCCTGSVYASCYKITNVNDKSVNYNITYDSWQASDKNYEIEQVKDCYCQDPVGQCDKKSLKDGINFKNKVSCGNMGSFNKKIPEITSWIVTVAEILVPVILVIFGAIDFVKGIISQKEDEIKKGQSIFVKRLITGVIIFFVVAFTKLIVSAVSGSGEKAGLIDCVDCFISNKC